MLERASTPGAGSIPTPSASRGRRSRSASRPRRLNAQADTYADLWEVLMLAGRREEAVGALEHALARYEAKENVVSAGRMRERLATLRAEVG